MNKIKIRKFDQVNPGRPWLAGHQRCPHEAANVGRFRWFATHAEALAWTRGHLSWHREIGR